MHLVERNVLGSDPNSNNIAGAWAEGVTPPWGRARIYHALPGSVHGALKSYDDICQIRVGIAAQGHLQVTRTVSIGNRNVGGGVAGGQV